MRISDWSSDVCSSDLLYNGAMNAVAAYNWEAAAKGFDEVERQHPYSVWATKAEIMGAYAYYQQNKYTDAVSAAQRFLQLHPGNKDAPYAYYLIAICYYEQITDVGRDQTIRSKARRVGKVCVSNCNTRWC